MKLQHIFSTYSYQGNNGLAGIKYCSHCGEPYELREESGKMRPVCPRCGFIYYKNPSPGVSVLLVENGQVLLCKRGPGNFQSGKWCLPCGFMEFDEDYLMAARREVKEETGLDVVLQNIINVTYNFLSSQVHSLVIVLTAQIIGGTLSPGDDIEAVKWYPLQGPLPEMAFAADAMIIEEYRDEKLAEIPVD
ncbi:MAG TPA: NUDIX hydrolase [Firmicutes bacterium]|jgi:8-oxo-dGTP diphosphatase|nr:NUDIX hydrolase [Bacillota bacterium]